MRFMGLALISIFAFSASVHADIFDLPKTQTVLQKKYDIKNEITAQLGYLPKDGFNKYIVLGASYTKTFSDFTSWELINAQYDLGLTAGLTRQLADLGYSVANIAVQNFSATTNIVFSPVYTKNLLFNSSIVYSQFSFVVGGGVADFNLGIVPEIDAGFILRFFLNPKTFLKFDLRYHKFLVANWSIGDNYSIILGYAFNLTSGEPQ